MATLWTFIKALPELLALIKSIQAAIDEANVDRKVKDDIKTIGAAFDANDPAALRKLFNT